MTAPLCFLDTETDGIHPDRKVWEVAAIRREPDGSERTTHAFVQIDLQNADPFGLRVGGFYNRHPLGRILSGQADDRSSARSYIGEDPVIVAETIAAITHGAHIVGAVPNFDTEVLAALLRYCGFTPAWHYHLVDVENLAVGYLAGQGTPLAPPWSSDLISEMLGLDPVPAEERHTALGDARWAQRVYDRVLGLS